MEIKSRIIKREKVDWKLFSFLQNENFKELTKEDYQKLRNSLIENNFIEPFKVWENESKLFCLDGYHRCKVLWELEKEGVFVPKLLDADFIDCKDINEAANLVLIYSSIYATVTKDGLYEYLNSFDIDINKIIDKVDIPSVDIKNFVDEFYTEQDEHEDELPEVDEMKESRIKLGDLVELGNHRLYCGDSTSKENLNSLINGETLDLLFTDPPYGIDVVKNDGNVGGNRKDGRVGFGSNGQYGKVAPCRVYKKILGDDKPFDPTFLINIGKDQIIWGANNFANKLPNNSHWIVWNKHMQKGTCFSDAELAWTSFDKKIVKMYDFVWAGMTRQGNRKDELENRVHPTQKPVGLFESILNDYDPKSVIDLFGGSGSTLIACEKTNRKCFMMELDEHYCDVIVSRWCKYTGKNKVKINGQEIEWALS